MRGLGIAGRGIPDINRIKYNNTPNSNSKLSAHRTRTAPFGINIQNRNQFLTHSTVQHLTTMLVFPTRAITRKINPSLHKGPQPRQLTNQSAYTRRKGATKHVVVWFDIRHSTILRPKRKLHSLHLRPRYTSWPIKTLGTHTTPSLHHDKSHV